MNLSMQSFFGKSGVINIMVNACYAASKGLRRDFNEVAFLQVSSKGSNNFVSAADKRSSKIIIESLLKTNPGHGIICEEEQIIKSKTGFSWAIDPLDGTRNFLHNIPFWAISIALIEHKEDTYDINFAVIYDPLRDEIFWAEKNKGAFLNDRRIRVSKRNSSNTPLFASGFRISPNLDDSDIINSSFRRMGSNAIHFAYIAAGRIDASWEHVEGIWDIAAGALLIDEAGGQISDFDLGCYKNSEYILASNGLLHKNLAKKIKPEFR